MSVALPAEEQGYEMRAPCVDCGSSMGRIEEKGAQDCVYCECGRWQYNAPRTETGKAVRTVQTIHAAIKPKLRTKVLMRASGRCELCGASPADKAKLHVSHVVSAADGIDGGLTDAEINSPENLMCLCQECNLGMGSRTVPLRLAVAIIKARHGLEKLKR